MSQIKLVSFRAPIGGGKTFAADHLVKHHGFKRIGFADALKLEIFDMLWVHDLAAFPLVDFTNPKFPSYYSACQGFIEARRPDVDFRPLSLYYISAPSKLKWVNDHKLQLRTLLQWWGTEYRRGQSETYWLDQWADNVEECLRRDYHVVVDDARFDNEIDTISRMGGVHIYIESTPHVRDLRLGLRDGQVNLGITSHASESLIDPHDLRHSTTVMNCDTEEYFKQELDRVWHALA